MAIRNDLIFLANRPNDFRVSIGSVNVTRLVTGFEISKPIPEQSSPQLWSGAISLRQAINIATGRKMGVWAPGLENYSLDFTENPDLKAYAQPIEFYGEGRTLFVLRLIQDLFFDFNTGEARGTLGHRILSISNATPSAISGFTPGVRITVGEYAKRLIVGSTDANGASVFNEGDLNTSNIPTLLSNTVTATGARQTNGYSSDQQFDGALEDVLHGMFFENGDGAALEPAAGNTEQLQASATYPISQGGRVPILRLPYSQTKITPETFNPEEIATTVKTSGIVLEALQVNASEYPKVIPTAVSGSDVLEETEIDEPSDSGDRISTTYTRRAQQRWLNPESTATNIITRSETRTETFGPQGEPQRRERNFSLTRHEASRWDQIPIQGFTAPESALGDMSLFPGLEIVTEWEYENGHQKRRATEYKLARQYVFEGEAGDGLVTILSEGVRYEPKGRSNVTPTWFEIPFEEVPRGLVNGTGEQTLVARPGYQSEPRELPGVPQPEYREPREAIQIQRLATNREIEVLGLDANPRQAEVSAQYSTSAESVERLTQVLATMNTHERQTWDVQMALPGAADDLTSYALYHIDNGFKAISCIRSGPYLRYENDGVSAETLTFGFTARSLGDLSDRIRPIIPPVQPVLYIPPPTGVPTPPPIPLTIAAITSAIESAPATAIPPITLQAYGGTPPYTFSATNLPAGLSIVGNQIVGTVTTAMTEATVTVTVTDAVLDTATTRFSSKVEEIASPISIYVFPATASGGALSGGSAIEIVLPSDFSSGGALGGGTSAEKAYVVEALGGALGGGTGVAREALAESSGGALGGVTGEEEAIIVEASGGALGGVTGEEEAIIVEGSGGALGGGIAEELPAIAEGSGGALGDVTGEEEIPLVIPSNTLVHYSLDEVSGDRLNSVPGGPSLIQAGTVGNAAAVVGNGAVFDDNAANYLFSDDPLFENWGDNTRYICCFVRIDTRSGFRTILSKGNPTSSTRSMWLFYSSTNNRIIFLVSANGGSFNQTEKSNAPTGFIFVEAYYNQATSEIGVTFDMQPFATVAQTGGFNNTSAQFRIGVRSNNSSALDGIIDNVFILNEVPSLADRTFLYNSGNGRTIAEWAAHKAIVIPSNTLVHYSLDEVSGDRLNSVPSGPPLIQAGTVGNAAAVVGNGAVFDNNAANHLFSDDSFFNWGDNTRYICCFVRIDDQTGIRTVFAKYIPSGTNRSYWLSYSSTNDRIFWSVSDDGSGGGVNTVEITGVPTGFIFVEAYYNQVANEIGVTFNMQPFITTSHIGGFHDSSVQFRMGERSNGDTIQDGVIDNLFILNEVPSLADRTFLYNSGNGRTFTEWVAHKA